MKKAIIAVLLSTLCFYIFNDAQAQDSKYKLPPDEILQLALAQKPPTAMMDDKHQYMVYLFRPAYKSLEDLSQDEVRLAGLRVNPRTRIASNTTFVNNIKWSKFGDTTQKEIVGLPSNLKASNFSWSTNDKLLAFTNTVKDGNELWLVDFEKNTAIKISGNQKLNASMGAAFQWLPNSAQLIVRIANDEVATALLDKSAMPEGPAISVSEGKASQNRTYADMLRNAQDEINFDKLVSSEIKIININGTISNFLPKDIYSRISASPDGNFIMISKVSKPYSYIVPYSRFPQTTLVYNIEGKEIKKLNEQPLLEVMPKGFSSVQKGKRNFDWRDDMPNTLMYVEALDEGDQSKAVDYRDAIYTFAAPFAENAKLIMKTKNRFSGIMWGNSTTAIVQDSWYDTRNEKCYVINPTINNEAPIILWDRNYQDTYNDPGNFMMRATTYGTSVLDIAGDEVMLNADGFTADGQAPFISKMNLKTGKKSLVYKSLYTDKKEDILDFVDDTKKAILVRVQSPTQYPNYFVRTLKGNKLKQVSNFANPYTALIGVAKKVIKYKRNDGLELSGTLITPAGYDGKSKLPLLIWAYPQEFKDRVTAAQSTKNSNSFTAPNYGSFIYWVTKGYAVLDDASFPIVGEGSKEPNDDFMPQLIANAEAAIDAVDALGIADNKRVAIGGHSYGAFMTANLLTHSKLFACGIARSGAYNRTLTPFGFQSEQRNYWDVPEMYNSMSPFMNASKMKTPLLLVHGDADNNPGTFTLQTERYFQALKGLGAPARMVLLPKESHSYAAKENILHLLWEQDQFLEKYLKPAK
jgi:dipeptidyl aminopeptidase/acylaminoacyl peptidase